MEFLLYLGVIIYLCVQAILLKYYWISENDFEESRSIGYKFSKYKIVEDYKIDFSKIRKLKFKNERRKSKKR